MEDKLGKAANLPPAHDPDTTMVKFAQAEPGHDVFAGKKDEKPKSESVARGPAGAESVVEPVREQPDAAVDQSETQRDQEAPQEADSTSEPDVSSTSEESVSSSSSSLSADSESATTQAEEAEADRARKELFPDEDI